MIKKCQGVRRKSLFDKPEPCRRNATGWLKVPVGVLKTYAVCDDNECFMYLTQGYPADFIPFARVKK